MAISLIVVSEREQASFRAVVERYVPGFR